MKRERERNDISNDPSHVGLHNERANIVTDQSQLDDCDTLLSIQVDEIDKKSYEK